jgi:hypothetical protein
MSAVRSSDSRASAANTGVTVVPGMRLARGL